MAMDKPGMKLLKWLANNWILALDADERITPQFAASVNNLALNQ